MIRPAIRSLLKSPGFTSASIVALALGIGANTAIFSLVNSVLLRPLPYKDPGRLVMLWQRTPVDGNTNDVSAADFQDWRNRSRSFEQISAVLGSSFNLTERDQPERISGLRVTASFFTTLGVVPALGGVFGSEEEQPGAVRSVVLSDSLWRRRFGGNRQLIGQTIHLDRQAYTVAGVMPPGFEFFGRDNELWAPLPLEPNRTLRDYYNLQALARLKPDVTIRQARAEMDTIARQLALEYPKTNQGWGAAVAPLRDEITGNARLPLLVLLGAVAFVLLIACGERGQPFACSRRRPAKGICDSCRSGRWPAGCCTTAACRKYVPRARWRSSRSRACALEHFGVGHASSAGYSASPGSWNRLACAGLYDSHFFADWNSLRTRSCRSGL